MTAKTSPVATGSHPDLRRPDSALVRIREWAVADAEEQAAKAGALVEEWNRGVWPDGLLSRSLFVSTDGEALISYEQWADEDAAPADPRVRSFHRRLSLVADGERRVPGAIAYAVIDVHSRKLAQGMLDDVAAAVASDPEGSHPWGIAANFHISTDGNRVVNVSEWMSEAHHEQGISDNSRVERPGWQRIRSVPGARTAAVRRFLLHTGMP